jgi:cytochrome P450
VLRRLTGNGLLVAEGNEHRRQRKVINPAFASEHIKRLVQPFWTKACELTTVLEVEGINVEGGYNVVQVLTRTTLDIIGLVGAVFPVCLLSVVC